MATACHAPTNPCHNRFGRISRGLVLIAAVIAIEIIPTGAGTISSGCDQLSREELAPKAHLHIARGSSEESIGSRQTRTIAGEHELDASQGPAPSTRGSFMATWMPSRSAAGYRLDVSTRPNFDRYVPNWHDVDIGNATGRVVTGLNQGTTYFYRVRAYGASGTSASSEVMSAATSATRGLIIRAVFDSSITANANAAAIEATINRAIAIYESLFCDPITINILFRYLPIASPSSVIAESRYVTYQFSWETYGNALLADAKTINDLTANDTLFHNLYLPEVEVSSANGRALQLNTPPRMSPTGDIGPGGTLDGIVTLNSASQFQFSRPSRASFYDAQRALEHEIDEVMGLGSGPHLRPQDLFSWASWKNRDYNSGDVRYFSINAGWTRIVNFNNDPEGDAGDWQSGACPQSTPYVQNAFACTGQSSDIAITSPEGVNLDVIGYDPAAAGVGWRRTHAIVADFNSDGSLDYFVYNRTTRQTAIWYFDDRSSLVGSDYGPTVARGWSPVDAADFDGDGYPDLVLVSPPTGQTAIWYLSGPTLLRGQYGPSIPPTWKLILTTDFDGDGKPDYVLYKPTTRQTAIWYLNDNVLRGGAYGPTLPPGWDLVSAVDVDGDGNKDFVIFNSATRRTAIWYLVGANIVSGKYGLTVQDFTARLSAAADFSHDGRVDFLIYGPQTYSYPYHYAQVYYVDNYGIIDSSDPQIVPGGWSLADP